MDWHAVLELVVTVVFLAGIALALLCLPYVGPVTWLLRARLERIDRERAEQERGAQASAATSDTAASEEGGW